MPKSDSYFQPGESGNPNGRPAGARGKRTKEIIKEIQKLGHKDCLMRLRLFTVNQTHLLPFQPPRILLLICTGRWARSLRLAMSSKHSRSPPFKQSTKPGIILPRSLSAWPVASWIFSLPSIFQTWSETGLKRPKSPSPELR
jgi:hypothetical protein